MLLVHDKYSRNRDDLFGLLNYWKEPYTGKKTNMDIQEEVEFFRQRRPDSKQTNNKYKTVLIVVPQSNGFTSA